MGSAADVSGSGPSTSPGRGRASAPCSCLLRRAHDGRRRRYGAATGLLAWDVRFAYLPRPSRCSTATRRTRLSTIPILEDQKGYVYPPQLVLPLLPLTVFPSPSRRSSWRARPARAPRPHALDPRASGHPLLRGRVSVGAGVSARPARQPLDPARLRARGAWRYRDRVWPPAWALGLAVSAKFLLWPMFVWTLATRRLRVTVWALVIGADATLVAWAAIGFDGLTGYPDLLRRLSDIQSERSYSIVGMAATAGLAERRGGPDARVWRQRYCRLRRSLPAGGRAALLYVRGRGNPRPEPDRVAALPRRAPRADGDPATAVLRALAAARPPLGQPEARLRGGRATFAPALVALILMVFVLLRPSPDAGAPMP